MKITKNYLKQVIKEEIDKVMEVWEDPFTKEHFYAPVLAIIAEIGQSVGKLLNSPNVHELKPSQFLGESVEKIKELKITAYQFKLVHQRPEARQAYMKAVEEQAHPSRIQFAKIIYGNLLKRLVEKQPFVIPQY